MKWLKGNGNTDILAKMVLKRDFLASDAQTIAEFVDKRSAALRGLRGDHRMIKQSPMMAVGTMA